jgi:hypothetical protein
MQRLGLQLIEALLIEMLNTHHSSMLSGHAIFSNVGNHPTALSVSLPVSMISEGKRKKESPEDAALRHAYMLAVASTLSFIFRDACSRAE